MTLVASRHGQVVKIQAIFGPISCTVEENESYARTFWVQLGFLLGDDFETRAHTGYERYVAHSGRELPSWNDLDMKERAHWTAAFSE